MFYAGSLALVAAGLLATVRLKITAAWSGDCNQARYQSSLWRVLERDLGLDMNGRGDGTG